MSNDGTNNRLIIPVTNSQPTKTDKTIVTTDDLDFIMEHTLTDKHRASIEVVTFVRSYLGCRDVRQASNESGLTINQGRLLLNKKDVHECIKKATEQMMFRGGIDPDELVMKVKEVVEFDPLELMKPDGSYKESLAEVAPEIRRAIKRFKVKNSYGVDANGMMVVDGKIIEVEFWDKLKGAEMLGRDIGKFKETKRVEHDVTEGMKEALLAVRERVERLGKDAIDVTPVQQIEEKVVRIESPVGVPVMPVRRVFPKPPGVV